ncbi:hypothetical protein BGW38_005168 [Lunasporangiospora selenospora]|uniref:Uncharacterized protein n=1 Tax=Lunasporangiospora selenospora TaxID=979761 RepID=A0A9P6FQB7_9FUNG|nr:hypothetical protein BGW38_005168 [Lunasporangiospora selenospora]
MDASSGAIDSKSSPKDQLAYFYRVFRDPDNAEYLLQPSATRQQRREDAPLTSVNIDQDDAAPSSRFRALQDRPNQVNQPNIFLAAKFLTEVLPGKIEEGFRTRSIFPMSRDGKGFLELATALSETEPSSLRGVTGLALHACYARLVMEYSNLQKLLETLFEEEGERVTFVQSRLADMAEKLHDIHIDYQERKNRLQGKPTDSSSSGGIGLGGRGGRDGRDGRDVDVDTVHWRTPPPLLSSSAHPSDHSARPHHAPRQLRHQAQYNHHHYRHYQPQRYKDEDSDQEMTSVRHSRDRVMRTSTIPPPLRPAPGPEARSSSSSSSTPAILPKPETTPSVSAHPRPYSTGATTTTGLSFTSSSEAPVSITTIPRQTPTPPHDNGIEPLSSTAMTTIAIQQHQEEEPLGPPHQHQVMGDQRLRLKQQTIVQPDG